MKLNENIANKVIQGLSYGLPISNELKEGLKDFFRTINNLNALTDQGLSNMRVIAQDGRTYSVDDYEIASPLQCMILPNKISVLDDYQAVEARDVVYYTDNELQDRVILTPANFKAFQMGLYYRARLSADSFVRVGELKSKNVRIDEIADRIAVREGFSSILGMIVECLGIIQSKIATEVPTAPKFPIVVNTWYKNTVCYNYDAEDAVVNYITEALLGVK